ncbi:MAG: trypsin-like peptidase domain-containing protein [Planctomycetaceae bacterium]|nr:trypsin-like peptidase domain-containing protein [Planctomycetales bacterium]MCB9940126.1 trypsin-like peptidase domain-containing protein [Planctomycetaceae bacterium]
MARYRLPVLLLLLAAYVIVPPQLLAAEPQTDDATVEPLSVEQIVERIRPSLVTISTTGREGGEHGLGTGFVVSAEGLIATNLHVIGEGREFTVELSDGTDLTVEAVHASDRHRDLAIVKVATGGKKLKPLELSDASSLIQGQPIVMMGNPLGLKHSVVSGIVSAVREVEGQEMIQLAIPIERGNSGGPVVDMQARVHGIANMKSLREENVGFAVDAKHLRLLLDEPNPISLSRWATIGAIDEHQWTPLLGARWRQRAGRIFVTGQGSGFGGRSLCISTVEAPKVPFELAVHVKLDDEAGAAGLIFHADGGDKHYGFYPTNGKLRLTCFNGPTVFTWQILEDVDTAHYRPGEWNQLKVRIEADKFQCFVNEQLVIESQDQTYTSGRIGLAKFRQTEAEFKQFRFADKLAETQLGAEELARFTTLIEGLPTLPTLRPADIEPFTEKAEASATLLRRRADELERRAEELRKTAQDVRVQGVARKLGELVNTDNGDFDLLRGALLLAKLDEPDIEVEAYLSQVDQMAGEIKKTFAEDADDATKLAKLNDYFFVENGFHGSRSDEYYHRANSYMNRVIDDREGIPVTLSVLYMELGQRVGLDIQGVGLPGHFVVKHVRPESDDQLVDVFERGTLLSRDDAVALVRLHANRTLTEDDLAASPKRDILVRMIRNLGGLAESRTDGEALLRYLEALVAIEPDSAEYRQQRAGLRAFGNRYAAAIADLDWLLEHESPGIDLDRIHSMRSALLQRLD